MYMLQNVIESNRVLVCEADFSPVLFLTSCAQESEGGPVVRGGITEVIFRISSSVILQS